MQHHASFALSPHTALRLPPATTTLPAQELMHPQAWLAEGITVCEGIQHPDAPPTDEGAAARQLRAVTEYTADLDAAAALAHSRRVPGDGNGAAGE